VGTDLLRHFRYDHLPAHLAEVSRPFCELAQQVAARGKGSETAACLRKLIEAKDCAVRAALDAMTDAPESASFPGGVAGR
jgi:lipopolysaccharide biosynthesis regulator YciM